MITLKKNDVIGKYTVEKDTLNLRKFTIRPVEKLQPGFEYFLKIPHRKFKDINGFYNDSLEVKVSLPKDDKLSTMMLNMNNVGNKYIVDLLDEKKSKTLRSYIIDKDQTLIFPYLRAMDWSTQVMFLRRDSQRKYSSTNLKTENR